MSIRGSMNAALLNICNEFMFALSLTLPGPSAGVSGSLDNYCSLKPLCSGMGEIVPARSSPTLLPPSPRNVLSLSCFKKINKLSCFKVSQCINCRDWHFKSYTIIATTFNNYMTYFMEYVAREL